MRARSGLTAIVVALLVIACSSGAKAGAYTRVNLPKGVSIEVPRNMQALSDNQRLTLDAYAEAVERRVMEGPAEPSDMPFAANLHNDAGRVIAMVNVRYYPDMPAGQKEAREVPRQNERVLDEAVREGIRKSAAQAPWRVTSWQGTRAHEINGLMTYVSTYERTSLAGPGHFRVRLVRVFARERSFTFTVSYLKTDYGHLEEISDHILESLRMRR